MSFFTRLLSPAKTVPRGRPRERLEVTPEDLQQAFDRAHADFLVAHAAHKKACEAIQEYKTRNKLLDPVRIFGDAAIVQVKLTPTPELDNLCFAEKRAKRILDIAMKVRADRLRERDNFKEETSHAITR